MAAFTQLSEVDPAWAWKPFAPSAEQPWNAALAGHLYRRAGFAANTRELEAAAKSSPQAVLDSFFQIDPEAAAFEREIDDMAQTLLAGGNPESLSACWLYRMLRTPRQLLEKTTLFWHGHFATSAAKVKEGRLMLEQNKLLRREALGHFDVLAQGISRDPAMLLYLDSATNRKAHPNENYARELMELFCLGLGNYTEADVQQLARCFTGWEVLRGNFRLNSQQQDMGAKTILGQTGAYGGEEGVKVVLAQAAAPQFIAGKLFRYFVCDEPTPSAELLAPLAREFRETQFDIGRLVRRILASNLFFSPLAVARKIRSPVELGVGLLRALEANTNVKRLAADLGDLGQAVFFPPSVKGWDGGRTWINSSTVLGAANLVGRLAHGNDTHFAGGNLASLAEKYGRRSPAEQVDWLLGLLVAVPVNKEAREKLIALAAGTGARGDRLGDVVHAVSLLPEFQLS